MEKGAFIAADSLASRSKRLIPLFQFPAVSKAAHQTMGRGRSHTHHGFLCAFIESNARPSFLLFHFFVGMTGSRIPAFLLLGFFRLFLRLLPPDLLQKLFYRGLTARFLMVC